MKVAITGAFSYSGKYVARRLLARGLDIVTLTGHPHRAHPFGDRISVHPLDFADPDALAKSLSGSEVLVNTYWIRFDRGTNTQERAVNNTITLVRAAAQAGVQRVVHISITNPSSSSTLPYFRGKARNENIVTQAGMGYAVLRPTVLFGLEDILINNIAYLLRRFPLFLLPEKGDYLIQPVYVDDLAQLAEQAVFSQDNYVVDAVGPEVFTFRQLVHLIGGIIGHSRPVLSAPRAMMSLIASSLGLIYGDVVLTRDEIDGLMANLLVSLGSPTCPTRLTDWLQEHRGQIGIQYASELRRHYV